MPRRPDDLVYGVDDVPPWPRLLALGAQHALLVSVYLVLLVLLFRRAGADHAATMNAVALGMVALAAAAALQAARLGPVGSGYLAVPAFSAIYLGPSLLAAERGGLPAVVGMTLVAAAAEVGLAPWLGRLRGLFPPAISGIIVLVVGLELGLIGVRDLLAVGEQGGPGFRAHLAVAWLTLAVMVGLAVWGRGLPRLLASSAGIAVGLAASGFLGLVPDEAWRRLAAAPLATVPVPAVAGLAFPPDLVPAFLIAAVAATLRTAGVVTTCQKINDADWKRPDPASVRGGVIADGAGCALGAALGTMGMSTAPSLVGVSHGAGATSRAIAFACAAILAGLALVPKFAALFLLLPEAVIGATLVFTASFMVASGLEIIVSRDLDARATIVVGVSTLVALARAVVPGYFAALPGPLLQAVTGSMLSLGVVTALLLNGLFRLGATRRLAITFESTPASPETLERAFRARATAWRLPAGLVDRAAAVTREVVGRIEEAGLAHGGAEARVAGDAEELTITILYSGAPLVLPHTAVRRRPLLEERAFTYSLADLPTAGHPDRMTASVRGERVAVTIAFDR